MENWKPVFGFEGIYEVSDFGRVRTIKTGRIKKPSIDKGDNRLLLQLWKNNKQSAVRVHRIVLLAFAGFPPEGYECCHNDGNPQNNNLCNLRWDTAASNQADRVKHGTSNRGSSCGSAKLTESQVIAIRSDNRLQRIIAIDYGVWPAHISRIKNGKRWCHLLTTII